MKLLFIAGGFASPGGIESFIHDLSPILVSRGHNLNLLCWGPRSPLLDEIARAGVTCGDSRSDGTPNSGSGLYSPHPQDLAFDRASCRYLLAMPTECSRKVAGQAHDHRLVPDSTSANVKRLRQSESIGILSSEDARFLADRPKAVGIAGWPQRNGLVVVPTSRPAPTTKGLAALRRSLRYLSIQPARLIARPTAPGHAQQCKDSAD